MQQLRLPLDLQLFSQEKTESATPRKRQETRKKGQVAKSMELPGAFILLFSFISFAMFGGFYKERIMSLFRETFYQHLNTQITNENVNSMFGTLVVQGLVLLAPIFLITVIVAIMGNFLQFGFLLTGEPLKMKLEKLNPINGAKNIMSLRSLVEFAKSLIKLIVIGVVVYLTLWSEKEKLIALDHVPLQQIFSFAGSLTLSLGIKIGAILVVLAVFDYAYQRYEYEKSIRMSKQDIKDEFKKTEGDPLIKSKIREKQRRMALQRMMQEVPKADVVITNPTHYAIAVQYVASEMEAPKIIAKGQDYIALKIKDIAKEHGVVTMENRPLARALYDRVDIGQTIPADLFQAVAEVLAYVYKLKGKAKK